MRLTKKQTAVLIGTVLGDAFLQKTGGKNARLRLEHSEKQKQYLFWKAEVFPRLFQGKPTYITRVHPKTGRTYAYWRWQSNASPALGAWHRIFYRDGKKEIPETLEKILTEPLALAVWYMDDGYYYARDRNSYLYLGRVSKKEASIAQHAILKNFGIRARVYDKKAKGFALYFSVAETKKLHKLIGHLLLPEFAYKLLPEYRKHTTSLTP